MGQINAGNLIKDSDKKTVKREGVFLVSSHTTIFKLKQRKIVPETVDQISQSDLTNKSSCTEYPLFYHWFRIEQCHFLEELKV